MENATKALLIAAAILIAILIISMGIVVYRNSAEQVNNANLSDVEKTAFNSKFEQYAGTKSKADVIALAKLVLNNNLNSDNSNVKFTCAGKDGGIAINPGDNAWKAIWIDRLTAAMYDIKIEYSDTTGLVTTITATEHKNK